MKVYLDNCCLNRPFDEQSSLVVRLETEAKLHVQELLRQSEIQLLWSFVLGYENAANPFDEVRNRIAEWKKRDVADCDLSDEIAVKAHELMGLGLRQMDASHVACAISLGADCFLSTDKKILNKPIMGVEVMNPIDFVRKYSDGE